MASEDAVIVKVGIEGPDTGPLEKALSSLSKGADTASMSFDELNGYLKEQADAVKVVSKEVERLTKEQEKVSRGTVAYEAITARLNKLKGVLSEVNKGTISYGDVAKRAAGGVGVLVDRIKAWGLSARESGRSAVRALTDSEKRAELARAAAIKLLDAYYAVGDGVRKAFDRAGKAAVTLGKAFLATGIGAVLGLLAGIGAKLAANEKIARAFKAVFEAMSNVLQPIVDYVSGIVDRIMSGKESLTGWYDSIGGIKGLFEKLLDFLKSQFEVRLRAIAGVFEGIVELDFKKVGKNLADAVTGVENTVDRVVNVAKDIGAAFVANAKEIYNAETAAAFLYEKLLAIDGRMSDLNRRASELNNVLADGNISAFERLEATKELNRINEELLKNEIEKRRLEYESAKRLHDATVFSEESAKNLAQMQAEINKMTKEYGSLVASNAKAVELMSRDMEEAADNFKKSLSDLRNASKAVELSLLVDEYEAARHAINVSLEQTLSDIDAAEEEMLKRARISARTREELEENLGQVRAAMEERRRVERLNAEKQLNDVLRRENLKDLERRYQEEGIRRAEALRLGRMDFEEHAKLEAEAYLKLVEEKLALARKGSEEELALLRQLENAKAGMRDAELQGMEAVLNKRLAMLELSGLAEKKSQYKINKEKFKLQEEYLTNLLRREDLAAGQRLELERRLLENKRNALSESVSHMQEVFSKSTEMISGVVSGVTSAISEMTSRAIAEEEQRFSEREKSLSESVRRGLMTQEQADRQRETMEKAMQARIKKEREKQAKIDKAVAIFNALLAGAQAVLQVFASAAAVPVIGWSLAPAVAAAAAAMTAVQIGIIASTPLPKFRKGVIALDGPGDGNSDSIPALLSRGESVMTAEETKKFMPTLMSIRKNAVDPEKLNSFATGGWVAIEKKLEDLTEAVKSKETVIVKVDESGFGVFSRNKARDMEWLDKRYRV